MWQALETKKMRFTGHVRTGKGKHAELVIPGKCELLSSPCDWPKTLCPGSLNIKIAPDGYPPEFIGVDPKNAIKALDTGLLPPAFTIPQAQIKIIGCYQQRGILNEA